MRLPLVTFQLNEEPMKPEEVRGWLFLRREQNEQRQGRGEHLACCRNWN